MMVLLIKDSRTITTGNASLEEKNHIFKMPVSHYFFFFLKSSCSVRVSILVRSEPLPWRLRKCNFRTDPLDRWSWFRLSLADNSNPLLETSWESWWNLIISEETILTVKTMKQLSSTTCIFDTNLKGVLKWHTFSTWQVWWLIPIKADYLLYLSTGIFALRARTS